MLLNISAYFRKSEKLNCDFIIFINIYIFFSKNLLEPNFLKIIFH